MKRDEIAAEMAAKNLTAPHVTKEQIDALLAAADKDVFYWVPEGTTTTVCVIKMRHFTLVGHSSCVDPKNFDQELSEKIAYDRAVDQLWKLEGYRLACDRAAE